MTKALVRGALCRTKIATTLVCILTVCCSTPAVPQLELPFVSTADETKDEVMPCEDRGLQVSSKPILSCSRFAFSSVDDGAVVETDAAMLRSRGDVEDSCRSRDSEEWLSWPKTPLAFEGQQCPFDSLSIEVEVEMNCVEKLAMD